MRLIDDRADEEAGLADGGSQRVERRLQIIVGPHAATFGVARGDGRPGRNEHIALTGPEQGTISPRVPHAKARRGGAKGGGGLVDDPLERCPPEPDDRLLSRGALRRHREHDRLARGGRGFEQEATVLPGDFRATCGGGADLGGCVDQRGGNPVHGLLLEFTEHEGRGGTA